MKSTMSCVEVPGRKISAMPDCFRAGMSASGMMPPTRTVTSFMPFSWRSFMSWGQMVLCAPESIEAAVDFGLRAIGAKFLQAGGLAVRDGFINLQNVERLFFGYEIVHADDDFFLFVHGHLVTVGGFGDFALRVAALDGRNHTAHGVDAVDIFPSAALDFVSESFDEIRAAERVDGIGDAGFVGDDLLRPKSDGGGEFRGQGPSFVERIGVERLRAAKHRGEGLTRGSHDVVVGLLRGQRASGGLRVEAQGPGARILGFVAL